MEVRYIHKGYVRFHGLDARVVSGMLADADAHPALQSDQRAVWEMNG